MKGFNSITWLLLLWLSPFQLIIGQESEKQYTSEHIGWTIQLPANWHVITTEENKEYHMRSLQPIRNGETVGSNFDNYLVGFQKDGLNSFQAIAKAQEDADYDRWLAMTQKSKKDLFIGLESNGIVVDSTQTKVTTIDGIDFQEYEFEISSQKGAVLFHQLIYRTFINGYDLGVNVNYSNETTKKTLLDAWLNSKFKQ